MRAGQLRHRVEIQSASQSRGSTGEVLTSYSTIATVWASVEPVSGREYFEALAGRAEGAVLVRMRYYAGLTTTHRLRWTEPDTSTVHLFEINDVKHQLERKRETHAVCREPS